MTSRYGMSDAELEAACAPGDNGLVPWVYWSSELYSFGKCFRLFAQYPRFLPIYAYADHGVGLHSNFYPHEVSNKARVFLTFHPLKVERHRENPDKRVLLVPHPWLHYRKRREIERLDGTKGTLVFLTHHTPGLSWENRTSQDYFGSLRQLAEKHQPVVLCLHMHDIAAGFHKELRQFGFPIVTAGNTLSVDFVDRFYELVKGFRYATSSGWGSQVAYCVELGLPYFFHGQRPRLVNVSHTELPIGEVGVQDDYERQYEERAAALFRDVVDEVTSEQREFVEALLGMDSRASRVQLSLILWKEFFHHRRHWWPSLFHYFLGALHKHGLRGVYRRLRRLRN